MCVRTHVECRAAFKDVGLIHGEKRLELLVEHGIGVEKRPATLYELDEGYSRCPPKTS
jgi:hypothetical protein